MKKVLCFGTFDILHEGHKKFLIDAKKQGDFLIANVISDKAVLENKKIKPINNQRKRALNLKKLNIANKIIAVSDDNTKNFLLIKNINSKVIAIGYDQKSNFIDELKNFLKKEGLKPRYYVSKELGGIHSSHLR
ncbi:MAG: adenylyltransferase/cytidyltransferase family protein [Nanoarchaeota archaeon]